MLNDYNLLMNRRVAKTRTNLGNIYFEKTYINVTNIANANITWLIKKKGTNWGMLKFIVRIVN